MSSVLRLHRAVRIFPHRLARPLRRGVAVASRSNEINSPPIVIPASSSAPPPPDLSTDAASPQTAAAPPPVPKAEKPRPKLRSTKAALTIVRMIPLTVCSQSLLSTLQTPTAVHRLRNLMNGPLPQLIRIGVRNKGCAGLSYHLEYVDKPGKFDEIVDQDGVRVVIDSKALFSIIGSEMDWVEDPIRCADFVILHIAVLILLPNTQCQVLI
jgi:iron-sulfur cluster assembly 1